MPIGCGWLFVCLVGFVLIALDVIYGCWYGVLAGGLVLVVALYWLGLGWRLLGVWLGGLV